MDGIVVDKIKELTDQARELKEVKGEKYSPVQLSRVYSDPRPKSITVKSLTGIIDYLETNIDDLDMKELLIHVVDHKNVYVYTNVHGEKNDRHIVMTAELDGLEPFPFERYLGQETFIIKCRSMFVPTDDMAAIIKYTAKIDTEAVVRTEDDGISQNVNIKKGVSGVKTERESIPSLVKLKPFRTFPEVDQPESEFLFRMDSGDGSAKCALFDADGGAWKNEARKNIADFFSSCGVAVIA